MLLNFEMFKMKKLLITRKAILIIIIIAAIAISSINLSNPKIQPPIKSLKIVKLEYLYGVPGWVNCYHGETNYLVVTVKNDGNTPMSLIENFTFCDTEPLITPQSRGCPGLGYGICPDTSPYVTLKPNDTYDFALLLPGVYQEIFQGTVCGKTFNVYLVESETYKIFDKNSITIQC
jgi:hypothetical protein